MTRYFRLVLLPVFLLHVCTAIAQQENVWVFGENAGVNFNSVPPAAFSSTISSQEACASVCDAAGQLLFYSDGYIVWDRSHNVMLNGAALITDIPVPSYGPTTSTAQGALIVPAPDHPNLYYIFSLTSVELGARRGRLYYSLVDMTLNGGMGAVIATQKGILLDSLNTEHLTGTVGDRCNVWVLTLSITGPNAEKIKAFEVTAAGVDPVPVTSSFSVPFTLGNCAGQMDIAPNRKQLAFSRSVPLSAIGGAVELFTFNPVTGVVSNRQMLDSIGGYAACFSPGGTKLYTTNSSSTTGITQYDLTAGSLPAIIGSRVAVAPPATGIIKRGPSGKVYFSGGTALSAFAHPDLPGSASLYEPGIIPLLSGTSFVFGLPNVVPVFHRDSLYNAMSVKTACFSTGQLLMAADTAGWDYLWSNNAHGPATTVTLPGTYWVSYHIPPCTYRVDTFQVSFKGQRPDLFALGGCRNDSNAMAWAMPAYGDTTTYSYTWRNSNDQVLRGPLLTNHGDSLLHLTPGAYKLNVAVDSDCAVTLMINVPQPSFYRTSFRASDTVICMGQTVSFESTSQGPMSGYSWSFGDGGSAALANPQHLYPDPGTYEVQLVAHTGYPCYDTARLTITVDSLLQPAFFTDRDSICTGQSIGFFPDTSTTLSTLDWQFGDDVTIAGAPAGPVSHAYDRDGIMPVQLTSHFRACPETSFTHTVHVYPLPYIQLAADTTLCLNGAPVLLQNLRSLPTGSYRYLWSTGDTTALLTGVHPGVYSLTISADPLGCSTTETITIHKDCYIDIPNAFTPNGDGVNDHFFPRQLLSRKVTRFRMQVFNRWGQVIFETARTEGRGWDGRFNSKDQPQGVYVYLIEVLIDDRQEERYQGNVTLIR
ncbi:PKD domain-containing protein [Taibaiella koreensis]|uniref:PKD domain-containing protein n=1 Tax=Taibaiella koreensis TaxID=1268548 RepID=UPI000E59DCD7|nr:PKD domain-containing protein [Taibaiella koreensis]